MRNKVLTFHAVNDAAWFDQALEYLKRRYTMLNSVELEKYLDGGKKGKGLCHLTVDDGDISFYEVIFPLLKKHGVPVTLFVSPKTIREGSNFWFQEMEAIDPDKFRDLLTEKLGIDAGSIAGIPVYTVMKNLKIRQVLELIDDYKEKHGPGKMGARNINVDQLKELDRSELVEIGAHTLNHPILANEDDQTSEKEIRGSFSGLEEILGHSIRTFAYPNGMPGIDFGEREIKTLKETGCTLAFSAEPRTFSLRETPFNFPRYVFDPHNMLVFKAKLRIGDSLYRARHLVIEDEGKTRMKLKEKIEALQ